jgi:hypothetical protein
MNHHEIETIDSESLKVVHGGGWWQNAKNTFWNTIGYAGPSGASDVAGAIPAAAGAAMLAPQGMSRNQLVNSLADPKSTPAQTNSAFSRYSSGPGQRLVGHLK